MSLTVATDGLSNYRHHTQHDESAIPSATEGGDISSRLLTQ